MQDGARRSFTPTIALYTYGFSGATIKTANCSDVVTPIGQSLGMKLGTIIKGSGPDYYAIGGPGYYISSTSMVKYSFSSAQAYAALGFSSADAVTLPDGYINTIPTAIGALNGTVHPSGTVVNFGGSNYLTQGASLVSIPNQIVQNSWHFPKLAKLATATEQSWPRSTSLAFNEGTLLKGSASTVWVVDQTGGNITVNNFLQKRGFATDQVMTDLGYTTTNVVNVADYQLPAVTGPSIVGSATTTPPPPPPPTTPPPPPTTPPPPPPTTPPPPPTTPPPPPTTNLPPDILIENINLSTTTATVNGWALDNTVKAESAVKSVMVFLNGILLGTAAPTSRPDICARYPGRVGCPNVGWTFSFDTTKLSNANYTLQAIAYDSTNLYRIASKTFTISNNQPPPPPTTPPPPPGTGGGPVIPGRSTIDRPPDAAVGSGPQVHVLYMTPSDGRDRQLDINNGLATSLASVQNWLSSQSGGKKLKLDTYNNGSLDVSFIRTTHPSSYYSGLGNSLSGAVEGDARAAGFNLSNRKYAMYFEGGSLFACGASTIGGNYPMLDFFGTYPPGMGSPCASFSLSSGGTPAFLDFTMLHELFHSFGAVQPCAPHYYAPNGYHTSDPSDIMQGTGMFPFSPVLDPGRDDYWGSFTNCLNIATSQYIQ